MYVLAVLLLLNSLVFSQGTQQSTQETINNAQQTQNEINNQINALTSFGISPDLCSSCSDDESKASSSAKGNKLGDIDKIVSGSCANPAQGSRNWKTSLISNYVEAVHRRCCVNGATTFTAIQTAYDNCNSKGCSGCNSEIYNNTCCGNQNDDTCNCNDEKSKYLQKQGNDCASTYNDIVKKVKNQLSDNKKQCKAYTSSKTSLDKLLQLLADLGILADKIFGHKDTTTTTPTVSLTCAQKCSNQNDNAADYNACLCATTETLTDGSTRSCLPKSQCTPDTSCKATMENMKSQGICSGSDCDDLLQSCICDAKAKAPGGVAQTWDPASGKCVPTGTGPDDPTTHDITYNKDNTTPTPPTTTPPTNPDNTDSSITSPVGTGAPGGTSLNAPGSGVDKLNTTKKDKDADKSKLNPLNKNASNQYKPGTNPYSGGNFGGPDSSEGNSSAAKDATDIVKETGTDIWKIIRDIYQSGIDANRFMGPTVAEKLNKSIKKGVKKTKGKHA